MLQRAPLLVPLLSLLLLAAVGAGAQSLTGKQDSDQPIEIVADNLEVMRDQHVAVFRGNVNATQGNLRLKADELTVHYKGSKQGGSGDIAGSISRIEAAGGVFISSPTETARGESGVYDIDRREISLSGKVVLTRGDNVISGQHLVMNMQTGRSRIDGGEPGSPGGQARVHSIFVPKRQGGKDGARETSPSDSTPVPDHKPQPGVTN
jgi:lipopolysaccharide export system protein LptA